MKVSLSKAMPIRERYKLPQSHELNLLNKMETEIEPKLFFCFTPNFFFHSSQMV